MDDVGVNQDNWGLLYAAWGDLLCSLSVLRDSGFRRVFYFGSHMGVNTFLRSQDFIDEVVSRDYKKLGMRYGAYYGIWFHLHMYTEKADLGLSRILDLADLGIAREKIFNSVMDYRAIVHPIHQLRGLSLSQESQDWAAANTARRPNYVLLCPYSFNSTHPSEQWPHWEPYLDWLLRAFPHKLFIYCGVDIRPDRWMNRRNFVNFHLHTPTAEHMYALASRADKVITTANGLKHWMNAIEKPVLVMSTLACSNPVYTFARILDERHVRLLPHSASLEEAMEATHAYMGMPSEDVFSSAADLLRSRYSDIRLLFCKCPFVSEEDLHLEASYAGREHDVYRDMFALLPGVTSLYEVGGRSGQPFLSLLASGNFLDRAGWCEEGAFYPNISARVQRNLSHFCAYYRDGSPMRMESCARLSDLPSVLPGYAAVWVGLDLGEEARLEALRAAFASDVSLVFCPGFTKLDSVRSVAARMVEESGVEGWFVDSATGLVFWDRASDRRHARVLGNAGLCSRLSV